MQKSTVLLCLGLFLFGISHAQRGEEQKIRKAFDAYQRSILNENGKQAVQYVDSRTIKYYSDILEEIQYADSLAVEQLGIMDKLMVLSIRHRTSPKEILAFDGKGLLTYAFNEGMVGKDGASSVGIGEVSVTDQFAKGQLVSYGEAGPFYFHFYKEKGHWKIDLTSLFPLSSIVFKSFIEESGQSENEFILGILEILTGRKPDGSIWNALL